MKICIKCETVKPTTDFYKEGDRLRARCKKCISTQRVEFYESNKGRLLKTKKEYWHKRYKNKNEIRKKRAEYSKIYSQENKESLSRYHKHWASHKRTTDLNFKLKELLRSRLHKAFRKDFKSGSAIRDLGCSIEYLKQRLENQFQPGMSWDNYGNWHIDHIIPLCSFDLSDRNELLKACHYSNLQPLWKKDNLIKGGRINQ